MTKKNIIDAEKDNPDNDQVVHALAKRRSELSGYIGHLDKKIAQARSDIRHLDAVLSMWGFEAPDLNIRAMAVGTAGLFHRGELPRTCIQLIRGNASGISSMQLAFEISKDKAWETGDKRFQVALADKITRALDKARKQGRVRSENIGGAIVWSKAN